MSFDRILLVTRLKARFAHIWDSALKSEICIPENHCTFFCIAFENNTSNVVPPSPNALKQPPYSSCLRPIHSGNTFTSTILNYELFYSLLCRCPLPVLDGFRRRCRATKGKAASRGSKFKDTTTKEQIKQVEEAFRALKAKISQVQSLEWGTNISPEKQDKGFTHCFLVTFNSEKDRDAYLVHPEHKKFVEFALPLVGDAFVLDFWAKN